MISVKFVPTRSETPLDFIEGRSKSLRDRILSSV